MNETIGCVCGWEPSLEQRKKLLDTIYATYSSLFVEHLQEKHFLPIKWTWNQYHQLLDKLDKEYHK